MSVIDKINQNQQKIQFLTHKKIVRNFDFWTIV
jgi:hypothetical protein